MNILLNNSFLALFLLANLLIGLRAGRGIKTLREYTNANKGLGAGILVATMFASLFGGTSIALKASYQKGLIVLLTPISLSLMALFLGYFIFPRLVRFEKEMTLGDLMETFYGPFGRTLTLVVTTLFSLVVIIAQLVDFGGLSEMLGLSSYTVVLGLGLLVTAYTCMGGIRSVAKTDMLQLMVILAGIFGFFLFATSGVGGFRALLDHVKDPEKHLTFFRYENFSGRLLVAFIWSVIPSMLISPPVIQRVLMTNKRHDIRNMFFAFAVLYPAIRILILLASFVGFSLDEARVATVTNVPFWTFVTTLCASSIGQLCFLLAVCAAVMSTMDSFLNSLSILIEQSLSKANVSLETQPDSRFSIVRVRSISLVLGLLCTLGALLVVKLEPSNLILYSMIAISSISIPFLLGLVGFKTSSTSLIASVTSFFMTIFVPFFFFKTNWTFATKYVELIERITTGDNEVSIMLDNNAAALESFLYPAVLVAPLVFLITHCIENKGFKFVDREKNMWKQHAHHKIGSFFRWVTSPIAWCNEKMDQSTIRPYMFGFFTIVYTLFPYVSNTHDAYMQDNYLTIGLFRAFAMLLCGLIMVQRHWPSAIKPLFNLFFCLTILYSYPFLTTLTVLRDPTGHAILFYIAAGLLFLGLLVDWSSFLLLNALGILSAMLVNRCCLASSVWIPSFGANAGAPLFISILFPVLFIVLFVRYKNHLLATYKQQNKKLSESNKNMLATYEDGNEQIHDVLHKEGYVMKAMQKLTDQMQAEEYDEKRIKILRSAMNFFKRMGNLSAGFLYLDIQPVGINRLLDKAREDLLLKGIDPSDDIKLYTRTETATILCDVTYLTKLIINALQVIQEQTPATTMHLFVDDALLDYNLSKSESKNGKLEKALRFTMATTDAIPLATTTYNHAKDISRVKDFSNVNLIENKRITKSHYGHMYVEKASMAQTYVFPLDLKSVRPKIVRFAHEDIANTTQIDDEQDKAFLATAKQKDFDMDRVCLALKIAKHYHATQTRKSGEPFYLHPLEVAHILLNNYTDNEDIIVAALLHDTIEDTPYDVDQMSIMFGDNVANIVRQVSHLYSADERPKIKLEKAQTLEKLIAAGNGDSLLVKLVDRLHNMRTIKYKEPDRQIIIARETLTTFIPIAQRLGIESIAEELHKLAQEVLAKQT